MNQVSSWPLVTVVLLLLVVQAIQWYKLSVLKNVLSAALVMIALQNLTINAHAKEFEKLKDSDDKKDSEK